MKRSVRLLLSLSLVLAAAGVRAADVTVSGFGTLGYAISDKPYSYQRYVDEQGTFDRDSRLAVQVDAALSRRWSATAQLKFAPDEDSDSRWAPRLSWGFLSWRPDDDWLLRVGKLRIPIIVFACDSEPVVITESPSEWVTLYPRAIDLAHTAKLATFEGVTVVDSVEALREALENRLACLNKPQSSASSS